MLMQMAKNVLFKRLKLPSTVKKGYK